MKILVVCQHYAPEPFRHPDICEELVRRGHEVTVITGQPNYPMGVIYEGYQGRKKRQEALNGVQIHRTFTIGRRRGPLFRILNYYSYALSSAAFVKSMQDKFDVIFVNQLSPVMMANAAVAYKQMHGTPIVLYCLDLWPESLVAGGIRRGGRIYNYFHKVSEKIYRQVDKILVTSRSFSDYFKQEFGIETTEHLPQYAEAIFCPEQCTKKPDGNMDLMFAGNVGAAQSVNTVIEAAKLTGDVKNLRWHIVGDGSELGNLKAMAKDLPQIIFHGRKPLNEMPAFYAMADAMLVTMQKDPVLSLTLPGKVQTCMAAGKPVIGAIDGETPLILKDAQCGLCSPAEDARSLAENVRKFVISDQAQMGKNARGYYERHFRKDLFMDKLEETLNEYARKGIN